MSRWWNESFDTLTTRIPLPLLVFLSVVGTILIALSWYFWPHWLPWRWWPRRLRGGGAGGGRTGQLRRFRFRLGRLRWRLRWRRRRQRPAAAQPPTEELPPDELPDLPAAVLALTADELAAAGRYAEAVRERLRAIVRDLVERELIPPSPGWTATELARQAVRERPALAGPLDAAVETFSRIWYGLIPAAADDDAAMRAYAAAIAEILAPAGAIS